MRWCKIHYLVEGATQCITITTETSLLVYSSTIWLIHPRYIKTHQFSLAPPYLHGQRLEGQPGDEPLEHLAPLHQVHRVAAVRCRKEWGVIVAGGGGIMSVCGRKKLNKTRRMHVHSITSLTLVPRVVVDAVLKYGQGQVQEVLGIPYVACVQLVDEGRQVHRLRDQGQVCSVIVEE